MTPDQLQAIAGRLKFGPDYRLEPDEARAFLAVCRQVFPRKPTEDGVRPVPDELQTAVKKKCLLEPWRLAPEAVEAQRVIDLYGSMPFGTFVQCAPAENADGERIEMTEQRKAAELVSALGEWFLQVAVQEGWPAGASRR